MSSADPRGVPALHAVTADDVLARTSFVATARAVMEAGGARVAVHLRSGTLRARELWRLARELAPVQAATGARLVVNDRADVAAAVGAWGAQLTSRSVRVADAARAFPALALGASAHGVTEATVAAREGARWAVVGHVFETASHAGAPGRGLAFLGEVVRATPIPVIGIGGITPENAAQVFATGAHGVAAIRGAWRDAPTDAAQAVRDYLSAHDAALDRRGDDRPDRQR
jgi:thiamine-phosphate diphosphorylase